MLPFGIGLMKVFSVLIISSSSCAKNSVGLKNVELATRHPSVVSFLLILFV